MNSAFCISGEGRLAGPIIESCFRGKLQGRVNPALVIASKPCPGIERCQATGMDPGQIAIVRDRDYASEEAKAEAILDLCDKHGIEFMGLYGYKRPIPKALIEKYRFMMVNAHPAPVPYFGGKGMYGLPVQECVLELYKETNGLFSATEVTAQLVDPEYDLGAVIDTRRHPLRADHTPQSLADEIIETEIELHISVLKRWADCQFSYLKRDKPFISPEWEPLINGIKQNVLTKHGRWPVDRPG
jgi:phosphoribosylglycinamide formyltransferase-1